MTLIALDDGHGIETAGKRTPKFEDGTVMKENEFNSAVVNYLKEYLEFNGFKTILVAPTDEDISLNNRVTVALKTANLANADLYICVHANAYGNTWNDANGVETYVWKFGGEAEKVAKLIQKHLVKETKFKDRGIKTANFYVLKHTKMPAVLVECGFMTNKKEAELLRTELYRQLCARAICKGICEYFNKPFKEIKEVNWKVKEGREALDYLQKKNIINNKEYWYDKLEEGNVWLIFTLAKRILERVEK